MKKTSMLLVTGTALLLAGILTMSLFSLNQPQRPDPLVDEKTDRPDLAAEWLALRRAVPDGTSPARKNLEAADTVRAARAARGVSNLPNLLIEDYGPGNFGGRIRGISIHPTEPDRLLIGGVLGGVWHTADGGQTWQPSDEFMTNLAISCLVYDPLDPETVYAGTGEGFNNFDAGAGAGIFVSEDFGATWSQLTATDNSDFTYVNRLAITGSGALVAATREGLFRSIDAGASWSDVTPSNSSNRGYTDLKADPTNTARLYTYHYGSTDASQRIWRSEDDGLSWEMLDGAEGLPTTDIGRMEIGVGSDGVVYISVSNNASATRGLWRSPVGGNAFQQTASGTPFIERQGWYDLMIGVDPTDSDRVYLGAVDVFRTTDAGTSITKQSLWNPGNGSADFYVHADIHNMVFHPDDPMTLFIVTDGGVFKSINGGETFTSLNNNLRITQYYGFDVGPKGYGVTGGTQDNGTHQYYGDKATWYKWAGGDGTFSAWDRQEPNIIYGATPGLNLYGSRDRGESRSGITIPSSSGAQFISPFEIDPKDGNRFLAGVGNLYFSDDMRNFPSETWANLGALSNSINAMAFDPNNPDRAWAGDIQGRIGRITGLTTSPVMELLPFDAVGACTGVEVDPTDPSGQTVYATFATYRTDRIMKTTDGGDNWFSVHGDLPEIPVFDLAVDPTNGDRLYAATELGLFTTLLSGRGAVVWEHFDYDIAWTRIMQLRWCDEELWAATHGRGIYRLTPSPATVEVGPIDDSSCDGDGILDRGETVSLPLMVTNESGSDLTGITLSLSTDNGDLVLLDEQAMIASIAPGQTVAADIGVTISETAACAGEATLTVTTSFDGGTQETELSLPLASDRAWLTGTLTEDAEDDDTLFTHAALWNTDDWQRVTNQSNSGSAAWYTTNQPDLSDKSLFSPWMEVQSAGAELSFWIYYFTQAAANQVWDGATLQIRRRGGDWHTVETSLPYDGRYRQFKLMEFEPCWSGDQRTWREAAVSLADYVGDEIQVRFRVTSSASNAEDGFYVDDIRVTHVGWWAPYTCDVTVCSSCFSDGQAALDAVLASLGASDWPAPMTVASYVEMLNRVCP